MKIGGQSEGIVAGVSQLILPLNGTIKL